MKILTTNILLTFILALNVTNCGYGQGAGGVPVPSSQRDSLHILFGDLVNTKSRYDPDPEKSAFRHDYVYRYIMNKVNGRWNILLKIEMDVPKRETNFYRINGSEHYQPAKWSDLSPLTKQKCREWGHHTLREYAEIEYPLYKEAITQGVLDFGDLSSSTPIRISTPLMNIDVYD